MKEQIHQIKTDCTNALKKTTTLDDIEQVRISFLGRNSQIATLTKQMKALPTEEKRIYGPLLQYAKTSMTQAVQEAHGACLKQQALDEQEKQKHFDVTASRPLPWQGSLHLMTQLTHQLEDIFISMGYSVVDGPEVETDYYNFEALNVPESHPARDAQDTFWLNVPGMLLRTQTSNVQIRTMQENSGSLPIAIVSPGRVYRNEARDATHEFMFSQMECLYVDKNVSMANLLYTAEIFLKAVFEKDIKIRVRPSYFPFVEPGVEIDASCPFCTKGCSKCSHTTWIELLGAGMVHPHVLHAGGIDPEIYSGFAFGIGLERLAMIKHDIDDLRHFKSNKVSFLEMF